MVKRFPILCAAAAFFLFSFSCSKTPEQAENPGDTEADPPAEAPAVLLHGVILTEAALWELREDGKMYWKSQLNAGDTVIWKDETKTARRNYDNEERIFVRVDADGDYWVQDYALAAPAEPGVITAEDTVLYTKPDPGAPARTGNVTIPRYTLTAVHSGGQNGEYAQISARLEGTPNPPVNERYVKIQNLSTDPSDIGSVRLARIAARTENPVVRTELLRNALEMARTGRNLGQIAVDTENDPELFALEISNNLWRFEIPVHYLVNAETVSVMDRPSAAANVTGTLNQGDTVRITAGTAGESALETGENGETDLPKAPWYRTEYNGWVFGAGLVPHPLYN